MAVIILLATIKQRQQQNLVSSISRIFSAGGLSGCRKFCTCNSGEAGKAHAYSKCINLRLQILDILSIRLKYAFIMENLKSQKITNIKNPRAGYLDLICSMPLLHPKNSSFKVDACLHICLFSVCLSTFPGVNHFCKRGSFLRRFYCKRQ